MGDGIWVSLIALVAAPLTAGVTYLLYKGKHRSEAESVVVATISTVLEELRKENETLRATVSKLRGEVDELRELLNDRRRRDKNNG